MRNKIKFRLTMNTWSEDTEGLLPSPPLECDATPKAALSNNCFVFSNLMKIAKKHFSQKKKIHIERLLILI